VGSEPGVGRVVIYRSLATSRIRAQSQYRLSFVLQILGTFLLSFMDFVEILVIFHHLPLLGGWSLTEIAFLYGSSYVVFKSADLLMGGLDRLPLLIRMGTLDQMLTRPLGSLGQVLTGEIDIRHVGGIAQGAIVFWFALTRVHIHWTVARVAVFASMLAGGVVIFCSVWIVMNAIAFWTTDAREIANSATYGGNYLTNFPLNIFGPWLRRLLAYVIPLAFVSYFPALYLLGKPAPPGTPAVLSFISPAVALGSALVARAVWKAAIRHYRSTGS
jgi:ABC-2 type transport system permease protein